MNVIKQIIGKKVNKRIAIFIVSFIVIATAISIISFTEVRGIKILLFTLVIDFILSAIVFWLVFAINTIYLILKGIACILKYIYYKIKYSIIKIYNNMREDIKKLKKAWQYNITEDDSNYTIRKKVKETNRNRYYILSISFSLLLFLVLAIGYSGHGYIAILLALFIAIIEIILAIIYNQL